MKPYIIDVREPEEYVAGHAKSAVNIPLNNLQESKVLAKIPKTAEVWVYCRSGNRAQLAEHILKSAGYLNVHNKIDKYTVEGHL